MVVTLPSVSEHSSSTTTSLSSIGSGQITTFLCCFTLPSPFSFPLMSPFLLPTTLLTALFLDFPLFFGWSLFHISDGNSLRRCNLFGMQSAIYFFLFYFYFACYILMTVVFCWYFSLKMQKNRIVFLFFQLQFQGWS